MAGAAVGGLTSAAAAWFSQRATVHAQWLSNQVLRQQELYREFIQVAAKCYIHALQHETLDIPGLVDLYADISRMHVLSSPEIVACAETVARKILHTCSEPDKNFVELRGMAEDHAIDLVHHFGEACRKEREVYFSAMHAGHGRSSARTRSRKVVEAAR